MRFVPCALTGVTLVAGCPYNPETPEFDAITDSDSASSSDTITDTDDPTDPDTTDDPSSPSTSNPSDPSDPTTVPEDCGNGQLDGDEVCDDGTNDGSYGGCMADCSAFGPSCGDGEINGDELCDDGTNEGSYGGCAAGCAELGPHCGDGATQDPEGCDNGEANANGSGCNVDCVVSGTVVGTYIETGLDFCDGAFTTPPVFRADGNVLVSASGYCNDDTLLLSELSPQAELVQSFDDILLPNTPVRTATLSGDRWLLSAYGCTYGISPEGELDEVCQDGRVDGEYALDARDDGSYIALEYELLGSYPATSPMVGDTPEWQVAATTDLTYNYDFIDAAIGASGSAVIAGRLTYVPNGTEYGYLARYAPEGNLVGDTTFSDYGVRNLQSVAVGSDGTIAVAAGYPSDEPYRVMVLGDDFNEAWGLGVSSYSDIQLAVDSTGAVLINYIDSVSSTSVLRKWTKDGSTELWSIELPEAGYSTRMAIAPDDSIWLSTAVSGAFAAVKVSP